jgi:hypothetical protein
MTVLDHHDIVVVDTPVNGLGLIDAYAAAQTVLGGRLDYQRVRVRAAERFLADHPNLVAWMGRPVEQRLDDLARSGDAWPLITFALISTRLRSDAEFLLRKGFGHSMRRWVVGLYPHETGLLRDAAGRIGVSPAQADAYSLRPWRSSSRSPASPPTGWMTRTSTVASRRSRRRR